MSRWLFYFALTFIAASGLIPVYAADGTSAIESHAESEASKPAGTEKEPEPNPAEKIYETFQRGGTVMWLLLATSVFGLTFALERLVGLRKGNHLPAKLIDDVDSRIKADGEDAARLLLKGNESALAKALDGVLARRGANRQERERVLEDEIGRILWDMRHNIRPVGIVASVAPLIGLLGTVFGLINAFQKAAELGMEDPRNFAAGIYEALYTTAFGLAVAIPFLVVYHYLRGKADVIMREVEDRIIGFIIDHDQSPRQAEE